MVIARHPPSYRRSRFPEFTARRVPDLPMVCTGDFRLFTLDPRRLLSMPAVYDCYQSLVGAPDAWRWLVQQHMGVRAGDVVLDLGCGPGTLLPHLPAVDYIGLDLSQHYVDMARKCASDRQSFYALDVARLRPERLPRCDWVVAVGLLHHLDDAVAARVLEVAALVLKPGGRFISIDPCLCPVQSSFARWLINRDRGQFVRDESACRRLVEGRFASVQASIHHDLLRIPYTQIVLDCATADAVAAVPDIARPAA